jgi:hypothetical protein
MAKARKSAVKGAARRRKRNTLKTKAKKRPVRKARRKPRGIADKMTSAVRFVMETVEETSELRRQAGHRGGIDEG